MAKPGVSVFCLSTARHHRARWMAALCIVLPTDRHRQTDRQTDRDIVKQRPAERERDKTGRERDTDRD